MYNLIAQNANKNSNKVELFKWWSRVGCNCDKCWSNRRDQTTHWKQPKPIFHLYVKFCEVGEQCITIILEYRIFLASKVRIALIALIVLCKEQNSCSRIIENKQTILLSHWKEVFHRVFLHVILQSMFILHTRQQRYQSQKKQKLSG